MKDQLTSAINDGAAKAKDFIDMNSDTLINALETGINGAVDTAVASIMDKVSSATTTTFKIWDFIPDGVKTVIRALHITVPVPTFGNFDTWVGTIYYPNGFDNYNIDPGSAIESALSQTITVSLAPVMDLIKGMAHAAITATTSILTTVVNVLRTAIKAAIDVIKNTAGPIVTTIVPYVVGKITGAVSPVLNGIATGIDAAKDSLSCGGEGGTACCGETDKSCTQNSDCCSNHCSTAREGAQGKCDPG
jgi:hypothetical protein